MKRLGLVLSLSLAVLAVSAQEFRIGVNAGIDRSTVRLAGGSGNEVGYKNDLAGGISFEAVLSPKVGLQLEGNYSRQGGSVVSLTDSQIGSFQFDYVTIPLLLKLYATPRLSFYAGPQFGILIDAKSNLYSSPDDQDLKEQLNSSDVYAVFGSEYRFDNGIFLSARYNAGMTDLQKEDNSGGIKNQYFGFRLGYSFKL